MLKSTWGLLAALALLACGGERGSVGVQDGAAGGAGGGGGTSAGGTGGAGGGCVIALETSFCAPTYAGELAQLQPGGGVTSSVSTCDGGYREVDSGTQYEGRRCTYDGQGQLVAASSCNDVGYCCLGGVDPHVRCDLVPADGGAD
jgi:hypothetical protein